MFPEVITTDRLRLERCCSENVSVREFYLAASHNNPHIEEITEYLSWNPHDSMFTSRQTLEHFEETWNEGKTATYAIRPRGPSDGPDSASGAEPDPRASEGEDGAGELAGTCGLTCDWDADCATLGLWLRKAFWGRGYSGERADALLELAFEHLDLGVVAVTHHEGNEKSRRAIEKYVDRHGGRREGLLRHHGGGPDGAVNEVRYTISQAEYRDANGQK